MPAQAAITLNGKVYTPRGTANGVSKWMLVGDATFGGAPSTLTESVKGPDKNGVYRTRWVLLVPKWAAADSACACTGSELGYTRYDEVCESTTAITSAERTDVLARLTSLWAATPHNVSISGPEGSW